MFQSGEMEEEEVPRDMPMHYAYFRKNEECNLPYVLDFLNPYE